MIQNFKLLCGRVFYANSENPDDSGMLDVNAIMSGPVGTNVTMADLRRGQQSIQLAFQEFTKNPLLVPHQIVILAISDLGQMTVEEFTAESHGPLVGDKPEQSSVN